MAGFKAGSQQTCPGDNHPNKTLPKISLPCQSIFTNLVPITLRGRRKLCPNFQQQNIKNKGKKWGLSPAKMLWVYKTVIIPKITYACVAWATNLSKTQVSKLNTIQSLAARLTTRCNSRTPSILLHAILNISPIEAKITETALSRAITCKAEGHWSVTPNAGIAYLTNQEKLDSLLKSLIKTDLTDTTLDRMRPSNIHTKNYITNISDRKEIKIESEMDNILVFTDGSKDETGKTGYGIYFAKDNKGISISQPMNHYNTVFQTEVTAISKAAEELLKGPPLNSPIHFYTDSQSAINALDKLKVNTVTVKQCIDNLNKLGKTTKVTINWVPGHQNYDGNEIADLLANCGKCKPIKLNTFPVPTSYITRTIKNCYQPSEITLQNLPLSNEAKHITYKFLESGQFKPEKISKTILKLSAQDLSILIRALSDVNCLNYHMHKIGYSYTPHCEFCENNGETEWDGSTPLETISHILYKCPKYMQARADTYHERFPDENRVFNKGIRYNAYRLITFLKKTK